MESTIVLKMDYGERLLMVIWNTRMEKLKHFYFENNATFEQFIVRIYQVLKLSSNEYFMTVKIVWGTNYPMQSIASL